MSLPYDPASKASIGLVKRVPSGFFQMGSRFHPREKMHNVQVPEFEMAHTPVMVSQYAVFLECRAVAEPKYWSEAGWAWVNGVAEGWGRNNRWQPDGWEVQRDRPHHPVVGVTWYEVQAYCAWLSDIKVTPVRLPQEKEWEYAARGEDGRPFPWGELFDASLTNTMEHELLATVTTGSLEGDVSPFGLLDMGGNVQEWTASEYKPMPDEIYPPGELRVARGGSFNDTAYGARASYRRGYPPGYFFHFLGFRVVSGI